jgi:glycogen debranching enzyme
LPEGQTTAALPEVAPYYISAVGADALPGSSVLKQDDAFAILDGSGNIVAGPSSLQGVVFQDTRYLSALTLTVEGAPPMLLSSTVTGETGLLEADLSNGDLYEGETLRLPRGTVHIRNTLLLGNGALFQTLDITNYAAARTTFELELSYAADFVDLFELRGVKRAKHGAHLPPIINKDCLTLAYRGLDDVERRTDIAFQPEPASIRERGAHWRIDLPPNAKLTIEVAIRFSRGDRPANIATLGTTQATGSRRRIERELQSARIDTGNKAFDDWVGRARADLLMLLTDTPQGLYPYAGVPWFSTAFGRDGIITALQCLPFDPSIAGGTLRFLAANQATKHDVNAASDPGKILHEMRQGEMAALGEIPYGHYYGSVDSTPLFVMLADAYYTRTGDRALIESIWPNIEAAVAWIGDYGDSDKDGFIEYGNRSDRGLTNQGWKDTGDAIFHRDGRLADGPIALAEVQAYCHAAYLGAARLARMLGSAERAAGYAQAAAALQQIFDRAFWNEELGTYAIALDRDKKQCQVRTSNAGHVLFAGLATPERARQVANTLMSPRGFCGWGIRTVAEGEARYNPMSYHNGGVWPHDNALIAMGFARYGLQDECLQVMSGMFGAATLLPLHRLPELFCGFARRTDFGPIGYPVACIPQAWSTVAVFGLLGATMGISFDAAAGKVLFSNPVLPEWLPRVQIANLRVGQGSVDLTLERSGKAVAVQVNRRDGNIEVAQTS